MYLHGVITQKTTMLKLIIGFVIMETVTYHGIIEANVVLIFPYKLNMLSTEVSNS